MYVGLDLAFEKKLHGQAMVQESSGSSSGLVTLLDLVNEWCEHGPRAVCRIERNAYMADCAVEFRAYIRRRDLLRRSAAQKAAAAKATAGMNRLMLNNEAKRRATAFILAMANWPVVPDDLMPVCYNQLCTTLRYVVAGDDTLAVTARGCT